MEQIKLSIKINLYDFYFVIILLTLGAVYLWNVLPKMDVLLRLTIILIAVILIAIFGNYLEKERRKTN